MKSPLRQLLVGMQWTFFGTGPGATNHFEAGGFIRSCACVEHPVLQYHCLPIAASYDGSQKQEGHGFQAHVRPLMAEKLSDAILGRAPLRRSKAKGPYRVELRNRAAAIRRGPHCPRGDSVLFN